MASTYRPQQLGTATAVDTMTEEPHHTPPGCQVGTTRTKDTWDSFLFAQSHHLKRAIVWSHSGSRWPLPQTKDNLLTQKLQRIICDAAHTKWHLAEVIVTTETLIGGFSLHRKKEPCRLKCILRRCVLSTVIGFAVCCEGGCVVSQPLVIFLH